MDLQKETQSFGFSCKWPTNTAAVNLNECTLIGATQLDPIVL